MMNSNKALLLISASGLLLMPCGISLAAYSPQSSLPDAITSVYTHFTHTSHLEEVLLSSSEDFFPKELSPYSYRGSRRGYGKLFKPTLTSGSISVAGGATLSRCGHSVCNTHFASLPLAYELTNSRLSLKISPPEIFSASSPKSLGRVEKGDNNKLTQLAATCFVTDTSACSGNEFSGNNADDDGHGAPGGPGDGDDYELDNEERCRQEGYTQTACPEGQEGSNTCPYDSSYFEECVNSCPSNYVTCEAPYYGVGEACNGKYASCEKDTERACQELNPGYVDECGTGQQLSDDRCSYDNTYGTCCNTCAGYDNTTIPDGYVQDGEACTGCDGQEHYKIKPNPCDGYMDCSSMGGEAGAKTCLSGTTTMYDNCKACPNLGEYTTCPSCTICQYEECSGLWYATGCATNCMDYCDFCGG